jgi:hypothetical protein
MDTTVHDTLFKALPVDPAGWGVFWIFQVAPFHTSANVNSPEVLS